LCEQEFNVSLDQKTYATASSNGHSYVTMDVSVGGTDHPCRLRGRRVLLGDDLSDVSAEQLADELKRRAEPKGFSPRPVRDAPQAFDDPDGPEPKVITAQTFPQNPELPQ